MRETSKFQFARKSSPSRLSYSRHCVIQYHHSPGHNYFSTRPTIPHTCLPCEDPKHDDWSPVPAKLTGTDIWPEAFISPISLSDLEVSLFPAGRNVLSIFPPVLHAFIAQDQLRLTLRPSNRYGKETPKTPADQGKTRRLFAAAPHLHLSLLETSRQQTD